MANYRPQLYIRTADITVSLVFPEGTEGADEKSVLCLSELPLAESIGSWLGIEGSAGKRGDKDEDVEARSATEGSSQQKC